MLKRDWGGTPKAPNEHGQYRCSKCREWKDPSSFSKNKQQKNGLNYACQSCMRTHTRKYNLPSKYGITVAEYAEKLLAQGGKCACCGLQFKYEGKRADRPCVDHNHKTGEVRDLLCHVCNLTAGALKDNSDLAQKMVNYLKKWNC